MIELDRRFRLLKRGAAVVDLGAWPGGWLQVAAERVGPQGRVIGVDLVPIDPLRQPQVETIEGDLADPAVVATIRERLGRRADVVLSDAAPKLSGVRASDEARCDALAQAITALLPALLGPSGSFAMKTFMGPGVSAVQKDLRRDFTRVQLVRPESSRQGSSECYLVALGYRGREDCG